MNNKEGSQKYTRTINRVNSVGHYLIGATMDNPNADS